MRWMENSNIVLYTKVHSWYYVKKINKNEHLLQHVNLHNVYNMVTENVEWDIFREGGWDT